MACNPGPSYVRTASIDMQVALDASVMRSLYAQQQLIGKICSGFIPNCHPQAAPLSPSHTYGPSLPEVICPLLIWRVLRKLFRLKPRSHRMQDTCSSSTIARSIVCIVDVVITLIAGFSSVAAVQGLRSCSCANI